VEQGRAFVDAFQRAFPEVAPAVARLVAAGRERGEVGTLLGGTARVGADWPAGAVWLTWLRASVVELLQLVVSGLHEWARRVRPAVHCHCGAHAPPAPNAVGGGLVGVLGTACLVHVVGGIAPQTCGAPTCRPAPPPTRPLPASIAAQLTQQRDTVTAAEAARLTLQAEVAEVLAGCLRLADGGSLVGEVRVLHVQSAGSSGGGV
jgi:hypothetical protein